MDFREAVLQSLNSAHKQFSPYKLLYEQLTHLPLNRPIYVFALGKAAYQMAEAVLYHADQEGFIRIVGGLVIVPYGHAKKPLKNLTILEAAHPIPDEKSLEAGTAALHFLQNLKETDILLVLLSGGGSSLMEKPMPGVSMEELIRINKELLSSGVDIEVVNTERKKISALKGGKLLKHVRSKVLFIYAMSDVPGDKPKYISSNPFLPDAEFADDKMSQDSFHRFDALTSHRHMPQDKAIVYKIIANNRSFCEVFKNCALEFFQNLNSDRIHVISTELKGESVKAGREIADLARLIDRERTKGFSSFKTPCMLVFGGETFVNVRGSGVGGRCTELALAAAEGLAELSYCSLMAYATDGKDGFCDAAGAIVNNFTKQALQDKGIEIAACLENNDSYTALHAIDATIPSEFTGINVNDMVVLYIQ